MKVQELRRNPERVRALDEFATTAFAAIRALQIEVWAANARVAELKRDLERLRNPTPADEEFWDCIGEEWS
jgi:uncharacterized protein YPO0396